MSFMNPLFSTNVYDREHCLKYMIYTLKTKDLSPEMIQEIVIDSKILSKRKRGCNETLRKWILKEMNEELDILNAQIEEATR